MPAGVVSAGEVISVSISLPVEQNLRQGVNECGPYSAAAAIAAVTAAFTDPHELSATTPWRLSNGGTLPWGMTAVLRSHRLSPRAFTVHRLSDDDRVHVIASELHQGHPVILLGRKEGVLHYVTVLGYDRDADTFAVYDPWHPQGNDGLTIDDNGSQPGNRALSRTELLDFWRGGGVGMFYRWYAIVVTK